MTLYDESSGQVYTETVSAKAQSMIPVWTTETTGGRRTNPSGYRHRQVGIPSLQCMAMRSCLWHVDRIESETLKRLGWHHASIIYEQLRQTKTLSFAAWSLFQRAYPEHVDRDQRFRFPRPEEISCIVDRLSRLHVNVLTFLTLQDYDIKVDHLLRLINISTLAALMLDPGNKGSCSQISSRNIRDWGRAVRETGAFGQLKVVILNGTASDPTAILDSTQGFPALSFLGMERKRREKKGFRSLERQWIDADAAVSVWNRQLLDVAEQAPWRIWADHKKTQIERLHLLYDLSYKVVLASSSRAATDSRVSLSFGRANHDNRTRDMNWFFKFHSEDSPSMPKHTIDTSSSQQEDVGPERKKIRETKKTDIGSLLSTFL